ncbi:MAG: hypothetical protein IT480_08250 [Gammaproteobacteria bacterium]|nr:hypothetical protein [Gammaproteobacteria bacterium]
MNVRSLARVTAVAAGLAVVGCGRSDGSGLAPAEAARWMEAACGIRFAELPHVVRSAMVRSRSPSGAAARVTVTVVLPDGETASAIAALARNRSLHRRGQSDTRYSYESFPGARHESACELDTAQRVLYLMHVPGP